MSHKIKQFLPAEIPEALVERAISLEPLGLHETGWALNHALEVLTALKDTNVDVLGVDVLIKKAGHFQNESCNCASEQNPNEPRRHFVTRSHQEAPDYLRKSPDLRDGSYAYVLAFRGGV